MNTQDIISIVKEQNGNLINYVLTTIEAALGEESRKQQLSSIRRLILDKHNQNLRELREKIAP